MPSPLSVESMCEINFCLCECSKFPMYRGQPLDTGACGGKNRTFFYKLPNERPSIQRPLSTFGFGDEITADPLGRETTLFEAAFCRQLVALGSLLWSSSLKRSLTSGCKRCNSGRFSKRKVQACSIKIVEISRCLNLPPVSYQAKTSCVQNFYFLIFTFKCNLFEWNRLLY